MKEHPYLKDLDTHIPPEALEHSEGGLALYQEGNFPEAIEYFSSAIELAPDQPGFYLMRGTCYEDLMDDEYAERDFRKVLELNPEDFVAAYRLGMLFSRKFEVEKAVAYLKKAVEGALDPALAKEMELGRNNILFVAKEVICHNLGNFLIQLHEYEEGLKYVDEAIELASDYANPFLTKGVTLAKLGSPEEGLVLLMRAAELGAPQADAALAVVQQMASGRGPESKKKALGDIEVDFEVL